MNLLDFGELWLLERLPVHDVIQDAIEGVAWTHGNARFAGIRVVVASNVQRLALALHKVLCDLTLALLQFGETCCELRLQLFIFVLGGKGLHPVQAQVEVAAAVINLVDLPRWRLVLLQKFLDCCAKRLRQHHSLAVLTLGANVHQRRFERKELSQGVPTQVAFLHKLFNVLGSRSSGSCLVHPSASKHRHNGQHLCTRVQLKDGEEIRVVISQDIASDRDGVLALLSPLKRLQASLLRGLDADLQPRCVMILQINLHLLQELCIVRSSLVQPKDRRSARSLRPGDCQLHPVLDGHILRLAGTPNVASSNLRFQEDLARRIDHFDSAGLLHLKGLVVRAVLFRFLGHEPHVRNCAHGAGIESSVLLAKLNNCLEDTRIAAVGNQALGVFGLVVLVPHLAAIPDHGRHGSINDDVAGHMQVGNTLV
mmetsp:Transcript_23465/g.44200  ORF Transcript_23465/g.44200 Transcript_23465/m.44200 type:complete len:425 (-) Transcript_23465:1048-2322(-)